MGPTACGPVAATAVEVVDQERLPSVARIGLLSTARQGAAEGYFNSAATHPMHR